MGIGTTLAVVGGTVGAAGLGVWGAKSAANTQASAAKSAAELQHEDQQDALNFQKQQWSQQQANEAPFLAAGQAAVNKLGTYAPFTPPTPGQVASEPGYQFTSDQGQLAIRNQASATGNVFSGNTLASAAKFGTGLADTTYNDAYQRALSTYGINLNRLQSLAGEGLTSAGQLGTLGQSAANNVGSIDVNTGRNIAQELNNAGAAEASGYVGTANAISGGVNSLSQYALLNSLLNNGTSPISGMTLPDVPSPGITPDYFDSGATAGYTYPVG